VNRRFLPASLLALSFGLAGVASAQRQETGFLNRSVTVDGATYRYEVYVPANWSADRQWPVILFLRNDMFSSFADGREMKIVPPD